MTWVEVRGGQRDWDLAVESFEAHGWPVTGRHTGDSVPLRDIVAAGSDTCVFEVEVRLYGALRGCARGAVHRVDKAMEAARVEAYVLRAEPLVRDREMRTKWLVYRTDHRSRNRWLRRPLSRAVGLGLYDTGVAVSGTPRQALRLARAAPSVAAATAQTAVGSQGASRDVAVRPLDHRWRAKVEYWPAEETDRRLFRMGAWGAAGGAAAAFATGTSGPVRVCWAVAAAVLAVVTGWSGSRLHRRGGRVLGTVLALFAFVLLAVALSVWARSSGGRWDPIQLLVVTLALPVVAGLWLLVRQWTWGDWVAWLVPLVASLLVSSFLAAGSVLHALYADSLSLSPDDLDVPVLCRVTAAVRLLTFLTPVLAVPAWWGYARHRHHSYAAPGERFNVVVYALLIIGMLAACTGFALDSAQTAVDRTEAAARAGTQPPDYWGVAPTWVCVQTTVPEARLAGEGAVLRPERAYLSFGVVQGTAVLWDGATKSPLKLRADQVRLVPAASGKVTCRVEGRP